MFNPLVRFSDKMIPVFIEKKARYLVAQTYLRGQSPDLPKHPLLLSDYTDFEQADIHYQRARESDQWGAIIDLLNPKHADKLLEMCQVQSKYRLYAAFVGNESFICSQLEEQISDTTRAYIDHQTNWRPGRNDGVQAVLELIFGDLFMELRFKRQKIKIALQELEKPCVTIYPSAPVSESYRITFQASSSGLR